ncbi:RHS repeat-associated core domain-containing protein, partial [Nitrosomonas nitrosa]|uniref:RHS repeat-associated core domain-containing protein n=1 Tax=Nitrosomonas nitrosa TaxID=52442 RepID=UPI0023F805C2
FGVRYINCGIGQWLAPDPTASEFSPYSYVHNRPLNYIDRLGLSDELPSDYDYVDVPAFIFWGTGFGGFGGGGGFGIGASGYWKKQYYGFHAWDDPIEWLGYDWIPVDDPSEWRGYDLMPPEKGLESDNTLNTSLGVGVADAFVAGRTIATKGNIWRYSKTRKSVVVRWPANSVKPGVMNRLTPASKYFARVGLTGGLAGGVVSGTLTALDGGSPVDVLQSTAVGVASGYIGAYYGAVAGAFIGGPVGLFVGGGVGFVLGSVADYGTNYVINSLRGKQ